jgi:hypothetical protein
VQRQQVQRQQVRLVQQEQESLAQQAQVRLAREQQQVRLEQRALVQKLFAQLSEQVVFHP